MNTDLYPLNPYNKPVVHGHCRACGSPCAVLSNSRIKVCCGSGLAPELCPYINPDKLPIDQPLPDPPTEAELDFARTLRLALGLPDWHRWKKALDDERAAKDGESYTDAEGKEWTSHSVKAFYKLSPHKCNCGSLCLGLDDFLTCTATGQTPDECGKKAPTRGQMKWAEGARASIDAAKPKMSKSFDLG